MKLILSVLMVGLAVTSPFVNAQEVDDNNEGNPDSEEAYAAPQEPSEPQEEASEPQEAVGAEGPQIPSQLIQADTQQKWPWSSQPTGPVDFLANKAPAAAPVASPAGAAAPTYTVAANAVSAQEAATVARHAAKTAHKIAKHSKKIIGKSKKALDHARSALHDARVDSAGLSKRQKKKLKKAEAHLREATKKAEYGKLTKLQDKVERTEEVDEKEQMKKDIQELRKNLKDKNIDDPDIEKALDELEADVDKSKTVNDESKAELERLKQLVNSLDAVENKEEEEKEQEELKVEEEEKEKEEEEMQPATPIQESSLDIDTQMPYGDLEPFGREDTAQELTEGSIKESDEMVDQLERAEVAEEKRAVFRALTRLRGAAITSFDGVARSQTGNIDEYNKVHQWRNTHPLHHLADEESDVSKWAFPDNADF